MLGRLLEMNVCEVSEVTVGNVTVANGQSVDVVVVLEACSSIVDETSNTAASTPVLTGNDHQTLEFADCVDALGVDYLRTILCVPEL